MFGRSKKNEDPEPEPPKEQVIEEENRQEEEISTRDDSSEDRHYDVDSDMDATDADEPAPEGKGIRVLIKEKNVVELDYNGNKVESDDEEPEPSTGVIKVQNTGETNRITGINLELENLDDLESEEPLEESVHIGVLAPGRDNDYSKEYTFSRELSPIKVEQEYYDPENGLSPNFLGGAEVDFEAKIVITNTSDETIYDVSGNKSLNELASLSDTEITEEGEVNQSGRTVNFSLDELEAGASVELVLKLSASLPDDVPAYEAGDLKVTYEHRNNLTSGLGYKSVDGVSDFRRRVRRRQRETEPSFYDCEIFLENKSEFKYDLNQFSVFAGDLESQEMLLDWNGEEASQEERAIAPSEKLSFEFVYESLSGTPSFGDIVEFSVYTEELISSETEINILGRELKFMAINIAKTFLDENDEPTDNIEIPSYVETEVPTLVTLTGVGTYPLEGLVIADEVPEGFRVKSTDEVEIMRNGEEVSADLYDVSVGSYSRSGSGSTNSDGFEDDESDEGTSDQNHSGESLIINFHHLEDSTNGGFDEEETITVKYIVVADKLEPRDEPIRVQAHGEGFIYEDENSRVYADSDLESLNMVVIHLRDDVDISKYISARDHDGQDAYRIELEAENYGTSTIHMEIEDLIPTGFELVNGSIETEPSEDVEYSEPAGGEGGSVHGWSFMNVAPGQNIKASFTLVEIDPSANPRQLQSVYKG